MAQQNSTPQYSAAVLTALSGTDYPVIAALQSAGAAINTLNTVVAQAIANGINIEDYFPDDNGQYVTDGNGHNWSLGVANDLCVLAVTELAQWPAKYPHLWAYMQGGSLQTS